MKVYKGRINGTSSVWEIMVIDIDKRETVQQHRYFASTVFDIENGPEEMHWLFDQLKARYES